MSSDYDEIQQEIIKKAEAKALAILNYMDRTEFQLREKLKEGEFPPFAIEEAVEYVRSFHYIDDERYAENFIRRRKEEKSLFELRMELKKRGVKKLKVVYSKEEAMSREWHIKCFFFFFSIKS